MALARKRLRSSIVSAVAGETISALKAVRGSASGQAFRASPLGSFSDSTVWGVSLSAASAGSSFKLLLAGEIEDIFFSSFSLDQLVFLGPLGTLTQSSPTSGHRVVLGRYVGNNRVIIEIGEPLIL